MNTIKLCTIKLIWKVCWEKLLPFYSEAGIPRINCKESSSLSLCLAEILLQFYQLDLVSLCSALLPFAFDKLEKKQNEAIVMIVTPPTAQLSLE